MASRGTTSRGEAGEVGTGTAWAERCGAERVVWQGRSGEERTGTARIGKRGRRNLSWQAWSGAERKSGVWTGVYRIGRHGRE
jgi:hypothetical protein